MAGKVSHRPILGVLGGSGLVEEMHEVDGIMIHGKVYEIDLVIDFYYTRPALDFLGI